MEGERPQGACALNGRRGEAACRSLASGALVDETDAFREVASATVSPDNPGDGSSPQVQPFVPQP